MTKQYGILAFPAKHSLSPAIHNAAFKASNIDAQYGVFEVSENEFADFLKQVRNDPISGFSVSLPYKEVMMNYIDVVDEDAKKIGTINTVVNNGSVLYGYNTDFLGSNLAIKETVGELKGKDFVVIGAGGAARAVVYGLLKEGGNVLAILNRTKEHAETLAKEFSKMFNVKISTESPAKLKSDTILIQTTSIWTLDPNISQEEADKFCPPEYVNLFSTVMDIVYKPRITPLLKTAQKLGKKIITGDKMFLYQAARQFELWTEKKAPVELMRKVLDENLD